MQSSFVASFLDVIKELKLTEFKRTQEKYNFVIFSSLFQNNELNGIKVK